MNTHTQKVREFWKSYQSQFVRINQNRLMEIARQLDRNPPAIPDWRIPELPESDLAFASHLIYICAIDFAFTHFEAPYASFKLSPSVSGSSAASMCFKRYFGNSLISSNEIWKLTQSKSRLKEFFQGLNLPPLLEQRHLCLAETAWVMKYKFNDSVINLLEKAEYDAEKIIEILIMEFPYAFGSDFYWVNEGRQTEKNKIFLNKRAQLFPLIYHGRATYSNILLPLKNPQVLGPIVDYQIPKYLRVMGVLEYCPELDQKIADREILPVGSLEELEIRIATAVAISELMKISGLIMPALDHWLWREGQKIQQLKHHLTPTTAY